VFRRFLFLFFAAALLVSGCRRKTELVPDDAKQVIRTDSVEGDGEARVKKREYGFHLGGHQFICEARDFETEDAATSAAKISIAERPAERLASESATFAVSGRSVWLKTRREIIWCMLASGKTEEIDRAADPVRKLFKQKFQQITN